MGYEILSVSMEHDELRVLGYVKKPSKTSEDQPRNNENVAKVYRLIHQIHSNFAGSTQIRRIRGTVFFPFSEIGGRIKRAPLSYGEKGHGEPRRFSHCFLDG